MIVMMVAQAQMKKHIIKAYIIPTLCLIICSNCPGNVYCAHDVRNTASTSSIKSPGSRPSGLLAGLSSSRLSTKMPKRFPPQI